jgi:hypothetical protein
MVGVTTLFIEPGSPWENGYIESFNGKLGDELLGREIFYTLAEAQVLTECGGRSTTTSGRTARSATGRRLPRPAPRCRRGSSPLPFRRCPL